MRPSISEIRRFGERSAREVLESETAIDFRVDEETIVEEAVSDEGAVAVVTVTPLTAWLAGRGLNAEPPITDKVELRWAASAFARAYENLTGAVDG